MFPQHLTVFTCSLHQLWQQYCKTQHVLKVQIALRFLRTVNIILGHNRYEKAPQTPKETNLFELWEGTEEQGQGCRILWGGSWYRAAAPVVTAQCFSICKSGPHMGHWLLQVGPHKMMFYRMEVSGWNNEVAKKGSYMIKALICSQMAR